MNLQKSDLPQARSRSRVECFILITLFLLGSLITPLLAQDDSPPNVVLIISDDQTWTDFGFMGHPHIQTPNIDQLSEESLTFTRGYNPHSLCRPSLATIATGLYPQQHKIVGNDPKPPPFKRPWEVDKRNKEYRKKRAKLITHLDVLPTIPRLLRLKNYLSFQSGKWWEGSYKRGGFTHGMTEGFPNPGVRASDKWGLNRLGDKGKEIGRKTMQPLFEFMDKAQKKDRPFFVWYAPLLPHFPHNPPKEILKKYKDKTDSKFVARYWAMCDWFDKTVGKLLDYLDQEKLRENTMVLFLTDNGWIQDPNENGYAPKSKRSPYDGGTRTPMMIRWPGHVEPGMDRSSLASSIDIAPTILRAAGIEPTEEMAGINLLNEEKVKNREAIFGRAYFHDIQDLDDPKKSLRYQWVIDQDHWKLIEPYPENVDQTKPELYNLDKDPHEEKNVASEHSDKVKELQERLDDWSFRMTK